MEECGKTSPRLHIDRNTSIYYKNTQKRIHAYTDLHVKMENVQYREARHGRRNRDCPVKRVASSPPPAARQPCARWTCCWAYCPVRARTAVGSGPAALPCPRPPHRQLPQFTRAVPQDTRLRTRARAHTQPHPFTICTLLPID